VVLLSNRVGPKHFTIPKGWKIDPDKVVFGSKTDPKQRRETRLAAAVVIPNEEGEVLFAKRNLRLGGVWSLPSTFMRDQNDQDALRRLQSNVRDALGIGINEIELIGKRMGNRGTWQLLMHLYFALSYTGVPTDTGIIHEETNMPKYTEFGFFDPVSFLLGQHAEGFRLNGAGDCTRSFATVLHDGDYAKYKALYKLMAKADESCQ
jgi:ADP-ribose pyrophosphatase YjhB (NUDIX family)